MTTQISESLPLVPSPREWFASDGTFTLHLGTRVIAEDRRLLEDARTFAQDVGALIGQHLPVEVAESPRTGDLLIGLVDTAPQHAEGYEVAIGESVRITSRTLLGVKRATQTVAQLIAFHPSGHLPHGTIRDWPWVPERGIMLDVGRRYYAPEYIEDLIRTAAWYKLNVVHLHLTEWNAFRLDSPRFPGLAADEAYTRDDIDRFEAIARRYGVTILPEIDLPSHATPITTYWPETVWPCQPMNAERGHNFTVDVTNPRTREIVKDLLDEFVPWFSGPRFHIGADEYPYQSTQEQCQELVRYAEANGFANTSDVMVDFIDYMAAIVREHGKTAQAWGWWDAAGSPSRGPDARIVVEAYGDDIFAEGAAGARHMLDRGYQVVHADGNQLYVTPGLDLLPDTERLYAHWPVPNDPNHPNLLGYLVSRWADEREDEPDAYHDWFAHRAQQVLADRTWGGPPARSHLELESRADRIGPPPGVTTGQVVIRGEGRPVTVKRFGDPDSSFIGADAGAPVRVTKVRLLPRSAAAEDLDRMTGGRLQGSAEGPERGWIDLARVPWRPPGRDWIQLPVHDDAAYRWLRYLSPDGECAGIAEVEFYTDTGRSS